MISQNKIQTKTKTHTSKVWYGNPQVELIEGNITYSRINFILEKNLEREYNENELESIKQYIWEINMKNDLIQASELLCINVPNKISINEFLNTISIYLSYINFVRVYKSPIPNFYFIYLQLKNKEYANILYNTFNYAKVNPIEKEYFIFVEVREVKFEEFFFNELSYKNSKRLNGIKVLVSPSNKSSNGDQNKIFRLDKSNELEIEDPQDKSRIKFTYNDSEKITKETENSNLDSSSFNAYQNNYISIISSKAEINLCAICLDLIDLHNFSTNYLTSTNGIIHVLCGHIFHIECSLKLDDDKCPMCRYNLSPANVSSCSLCSCENDLWMCLICGNINCGVEGGSNNHRHEHYLNTGHIYAKGLGNTHNVTFDFTKNAPLNILLQNSFRIFTENQNLNLTNSNNYFLNNDDMFESNSNTTDSFYFKDPKEKVQFIVSEYNSIISSQLENQRLYYLNYMKKLDERFKEEEFMIDNELIKTQKDLEELHNECSLWNNKKTQMMESVKLKEVEVKRVENELKNTENDYKILVQEKENIQEGKKKKHKELVNNILQVENEIDGLESQIKDLKIHLNTLNKIGKSKTNNKNEISGATIEFIANIGNSGNKKKYKNTKNK